MQARHLLRICLLLPALCAASEPNPFLSPDANKKIQPAPNLFVSHLRISSKKEPILLAANNSPMLPPPLPPALPPTMLEPRVALPPLETPARKQSGQKSCTILGLPEVPAQAEAGGFVTLKISDATSRCIAGIESSDEWLHIKFFNGRELQLQIDPNPTHRQRESTLMFASTTDSQQLGVTQNGAAARSP
jgi:hypothetical protein